MSALDYGILAVIAVFIVLCLRFIIKRRKKGGCAGCSGDCSSCGYKSLKNEDINSK